MREPQTKTKLAGDLFWFNLATDESDPTLSFTTSWIREMSRLVGYIQVVSMRLGSFEKMPPNVELYSLGKESGASEPRRAFRFYRRLHEVLHRRDIRFCFSHMTPIFTIMAAPLLKAYGVPVVTWYAHRQVTRRLRWADRLSAKVVSVNAESYPFSSRKLVEVGHGIDTGFFAPDPEAKRSPHDVLIVSRVSPIKDPGCLFDVLPELRKAGFPVRCRLVGSAPDRDRDFEMKLKMRVARDELDGLVEFAGPAEASQVLDWYRRSGVHVNLAPADHSVDKAPLEAMASGLVSFSSAASLRETFGRYGDLLHFSENNPDDLKQKLLFFFQLSSAEKDEMAAYLRSRVDEMHGLKRLAGRLVDVFRSCIPPKKGDAA